MAPSGASIEAVVLPNALVQGSSPLSLDLRRRYGINLVAAARQGRRFEGRLRDATLSPGDVLLLEGEPARLRAAIAELGCLPLERPQARASSPGASPCRSACSRPGSPLAASGILPAAAAFTLVVVAMLLLRVIRPAQVYESIDWPVIVLLGAMIPLGDALQDTGAAQLIAGSILMIAGEVGPYVDARGRLLMMTMAITPVLNNAATVVIMAPIVISIAARMGVVAGRVPDRGRDRRVVRFPDALRPPQQHHHHGAGRLPLRRLLAGRARPRGRSWSRYRCW